MRNQIQLLCLTATSFILSVHPGKSETYPAIPYPHFLEVELLAFSPNGDVLASANSRGEVKLHDTRNGNQILTLFDKGNRPVDLVFDRSGKYLMLRQAINITSIWDIRNGTQLIGGNQGFHGGFFDSDSASAILVDNEFKLHRLALPNGDRTEIRDLKKLNLIRGIYFPVSTDRFLCAKWRQGFGVFNLTSGSLKLMKNSGTTSIPETVLHSSFLPNEKLACLASSEGLYLTRLDFEKGTYLIERIADGFYSHVRFLDNGQIVAKGNKHGFEWFDPEHQTMTRMSFGKGDGIAISPKHGRVAYSAENRLTVADWENSRPGTIRWTSSPFTNFGNTLLDQLDGLRVALDSSGRSFCWVTTDSQAFQLDFGENRLSLNVAKLDHPRLPDSESSVKILSDGNLMTILPSRVSVFSSQSGGLLDEKSFDAVFATYRLPGTDRCGHRNRLTTEITRWSGNRLEKVTDQKSPVAQSLTFSETATMAVRIEKLDEGCTLHLQPDRPGDSASFTIDSYLSGYSHDFRISGDPTPVLTTFTENHQLRITGNEVEEIEIKRPWGNDLRGQIDPRSIPNFPNWCVRWELGFDYSFSVFDLDGSARIWEATHWNERERLHRHFPIGFSPNGRGLWSCGQDGRPILWDVRTGRPIARVTLDVDRMVAFVESPEGQLFATSPRAVTIEQSILNEEARIAYRRKVKLESTESDSFRGLLSAFGY